MFMERLLSVFAHKQFLLLTAIGIQNLICPVYNVPPSLPLSFCAGQN